MRIIRRHAYKREKDVLIAEVYDEQEANRICRMLNLAKELKTSQYFYQVVTDDYRLN